MVRQISRVYIIVVETTVAHTHIRYYAIIIVVLRLRKKKRKKVQNNYIIRYIFYYFVSLRLNENVSYDVTYYNITINVIIIIMAVHAISQEACAFKLESLVNRQPAVCRYITTPGVDPFFWIIAATPGYSIHNIIDLRLYRQRLHRRKLQFSRRAIGS